MEKRTLPTMFSAEWFSLAGIVVACFLFLAFQIQRAEARTDRLYEMFIDLRKDMDQRFRENDQKFYDLLKESKTTSVAVVK